VHEHASFDAFLTTLTDGSRLHFFTGKTERSLYEHKLASGDYLVFGRESVGLPDSILMKYADRTLGIPTLGPVRSLNLANSVALAVYEGLRQLGRLDSSTLG
jgi:tRNA (cytidine/uridine-2'-O-)-methyltransferase